jgi:hypothetical protein
MGRERRRKIREAFIRSLRAGVQWMEDHPDGDLPPEILPAGDYVRTGTGGTLKRLTRMPGDLHLSLADDDLEHVEMLARGRDLSKSDTIAEACRLGASILLARARARRGYQYRLRF